MNNEHTNQTAPVTAEMWQAYFLWLQDRGLAHPIPGETIDVQTAAVEPPAQNQVTDASETPQADQTDYAPMPAMEQSSPRNERIIFVGDAPLSAEEHDLMGRICSAMGLTMTDHHWLSWRLR